MTEQVNSKYELPRKELFQALNCLAISTAPIQMGLTAAAKHLRILFAHDFPVEQRIRFATLIKRLLEDPADDDLPRNASDNEGRRLAAEILSLYLELADVPDIGENATAAPDKAKGAIKDTAGKAALTEAPSTTTHCC